MSKNKKRILIAGLAVCLVALLGIGTLAYFTDSKELTNKFLTTDSDDPNPDPDKIFSIKLSETKIEGGETTEGNTYQNVLPGSVLDKDPKVQNTGKYDQWVRVIVTIDKAAAWRDIFTNANTAFEDLGLLVNCGTGKAWTWAEDESSGFNAADTQDVITLVYYLNNPLKAADDPVTLFEEVNIPASITTDQMVAINGFTIKLTAQAIQSDNNGTTPQEGFANWPNA